MRPTPALAAGGRTVASFLSATEWMLPSPATQVHTISVLPSRHEFTFANLTTSLRNGGGGNGRETGNPKFQIVRDDLLHPLANGNKARKLDALLPVLRHCGATDIVTCGGCQSAHAAAVAVHCVEWGIRPHILLRGEQPDVPTGYNLISLMFGNVTYASRSLYAQRDEMLYEHAIKVAGCSGTVMWANQVIGKDLGVDEENTDGNGSRRVVIVKEGAGSVQALLGVMRLVEYLSGLTLFGTDEEVHIVVDSGTGTTAVGLALGAVCLGLQWRVTGVMLADTLERYKQRERDLVSDFEKVFPEIYHGMVEDAIHDNLVQWVERFSPRRFGKVLDGEIAMCRQVAQQTGILLDPMYTLAAWEQAVDLCCGDSEAKVLMIHTGGTLGLFGLAQSIEAFQEACCHYQLEDDNMNPEINLAGRMRTATIRSELDDYAQMKQILVEIGVYFQIQDDYLDCFGDPDVISKTGTDIEDFGCSWLFVQALQRADDKEKDFLFENYGKSDPACVAKVKALHKELGLERAFAEYEREFRKVDFRY